MHQTMRLGKRPVKHDKRTLQFASYLDMDAAALPAVPTSRSWSKKTSSTWGLMLNDNLGDCTCAAIGHAIQCWTANESHESTPTDAMILAAYEGSCGYKPGDPSTDQGGVEIDVLNWWRNHPVDGHKIDAYMALEPHNHSHVKAAIDLFGLVYVGAELPISAQTQNIWSVTSGYESAPNSWGGHAFICIDYSPNYVTCVTWGQLKKMTWSWFDRYIVESYALLAQAWVLKVGGDSPSGFNYSTLKNDLDILTK